MVRQVLAKAADGGYCRLETHGSLWLRSGREQLGHWLRAGGGGGTSPASNTSLGRGGRAVAHQHCNLRRFAR